MPKLAREIAFPELGADYDYSGLLRRLELAYVVATNDVQQERRLASEHWEFMKNLDSAQRMQLVRHNPYFRHWGMYQRVGEEAKLVIRRDPIQAIDLTFLALLITENLDPTFYSESLRADFHAGALTAHANAKRLLGDFSGARTALKEASKLLDNGTGDPMERAALVSIHSSLLTDLGYFEEAEDVLQEALKLARSIHDRHLEGRYTIQQSSTIGWTEPVRGLKLADKGLALLASHSTRDKTLELCAIHLLALWANEAGDPEEARATFESYRYLYDTFDDAFWKGRRLHLQGYITKSEGDLLQSERFFRELVDHYAKNSFEFDLALASLDLSEVLAMQGKVLDSGQVLQSLYPILNQWKVNGEILEHWANLKDGMNVRRVRLIAFRELAMILRRKWHRKG
jgi:tetratricopeptide (TPR) repeat protein